jgi:hypothetical protein
MIITDGIHLVSDSNLAELHAFASLVGIHRRYFDSNPKHPHYDILPRKRYQFLLSRCFVYGAVKVSSKQLIRKVKHQ